MANPTLAISTPVKRADAADASPAAALSSARASSELGAVALTHTHTLATSSAAASSSGLSKIVVGVRVRPLLSSERSEGAAEDVAAVTRGAEDVCIVDKVAGREFPYDFAFGPAATNAEVYAALGTRIVCGVCEGYNGTLFAYGQTSSGKTYTITGGGTADGPPGVLQLAVRDMFAQLRARTDQLYLVRVSVVEIYNEQLRDLLEPTNAKLSVFEDPLRGATVKDVQETIVRSEDAAMTAFRRGMAARTVGATMMNEQSSRSHTIFRLSVESRPVDIDSSTRGGAPVEGASALPESNNVLASWGSKDPAKVAVLNLVDLAGSERASKTKSTGTRLREGAAINKSLLTLGQVIAALAKISEAPVSNSGTSAATGTPITDSPGSTVGVHIPYRDSKLTRLLQNSLGGNARTAIIANVSPATTNIEETRSTLQFASRARKVVNRPTVNETPEGATLLAQYQAEIVALRSRAEQLIAERSALESRLDAELHRANALERRADAGTASTELEALQRVVFASSDVLLNVRNKRNSAVFVTRIAQRLSDAGRGAELLSSVASDAETVAQRLRSHAQSHLPRVTQESESDMPADEEALSDGDSDMDSGEEDAVLEELLPQRLRGEDPDADSVVDPSTTAVGASAEQTENSWPLRLAVESLPAPVVKALATVRDVLPVVDTDVASDVTTSVLTRLELAERSGAAVPFTAPVLFSVASLIQYVVALQKSVITQERHIAALSRSAAHDRHELQRQLEAAQMKLAIASAEMEELVGSSAAETSQSPAASDSANGVAATHGRQSETVLPSKHRRGLTGMDEVSVDRIKDNFEVLREREARRLQEAALLRDQVASLSNRITLSESEMKHAVEERGFLTEQATKLHLALAQCTEERDDARQECATLQQQLHDAQLQVQQTQKELEAQTTALRVHHEAQVAQHREEQGRLQTAVHAAEAATARAVTDAAAEREKLVAEHRRAVDASQVELRSARAEIEALRTDQDRIREAQQQQQALHTATVKGLESQLQKADARASELAAQSDAAQAAQFTLTTRVDIADADIGRLQTQLSDAQRRVHELTIEVDNARSQHVQDRRRVQESQEELERVRGVLHERVADLATAAVDIARLQQEVSATLAARSEAYQEAVLMMERACKDAAAAAAEPLIRRIGALQSETDALRVALADTAAQRDAERVRCAELTSLVDGELSTTSTALVAAQQDSAALRQENAELRQQLAVFTARADDLNASTQDHETQLRIANAATDAAHARVAELTAAMHSAEEVCESMRTELLRKDEQLQSLQAKLDEIDARVFAAMSASPADAAPTRQSAADQSPPQPPADPRSAGSPLDFAARAAQIEAVGASDASAQLMQTLVLEQAVTHAHEQSQATIAALLARVRELEHQMDTDRKSGMQVALDALVARMSELEAQRRWTAGAPTLSATTSPALVQQRDAALDVARRAISQVQGLIQPLNGLRGIASRSGAPAEELAKLLATASRVIGEARSTERTLEKLVELSQAQPMDRAFVHSGDAAVHDALQLVRDLHSSEHAAFAADNERLTRELVTARQEVETMTKQCVQLAQRLLEVSQKLEVTAADRDAVMARVTTAEKDAAQLRDAAALARDRLSDAHGEVARLTQNVQRLEEQGVQEQQSADNSAAEDRAELEAVVQEQSDALRALQTQLQAWHRVFGDASPEQVAAVVQSRADDVSRLDAEVAQLLQDRAQHQEVSRELQALQTAYAAQTAELDGAAANITELVTSCAALLQSKAVLRDHLAGRDKEVRTLSQQLNTLSQTIMELEEQLGQRRAEAAGPIERTSEGGAAGDDEQGRMQRAPSSDGFAVAEQERAILEGMRQQLQLLQQSRDEDKRMMQTLQETVSAMAVAVKPVSAAAEAVSAMPVTASSARAAVATPATPASVGRASRRSRRSSCSACSHDDDAAPGRRRRSDAGSDADSSHADAESVHVLVPDERAASVEPHATDAPPAVALPQLSLGSSGISARVVQRLGLSIPPSLSHLPSVSEILAAAQHPSTGTRPLFRSPPQPPAVTARTPSSAGTSSGGSKRGVRPSVGPITAAALRRTPSSIAAASPPQTPAVSASPGLLAVPVPASLAAHAARTSPEQSSPTRSPAPDVPASRKAGVLSAIKRSGVHLTGRVR